MLKLKLVMKNIGMALFTITAIISSVNSAFADSLTPIPGPPLVSFVDGNGVDLVSGDYQYSRLDVSIGGKGSEMSRVEDNVGADNYTGAIYNLNSNSGAIYPQSNGVQYYSVSLGRQSQKFSMRDGTFLAMNDVGHLSCGVSECEYILKDGTSAKYMVTQSVNGVTLKAILKSIAKPDGEVITVTYPDGVTTEGRQRGVVSSLGWMIKYQADSEWGQANGIHDEIYGVNLSVQYCDPAANSCPGGAAPWPSVKLEGGGVRDKLGNLTKISIIESYSPCNSGNYPCLIPEGCYPGINHPCPMIGPPLSPFYPMSKITSVQTPSGVKTEIGYAPDPYIQYTGDEGRIPEGGDPHWVSYLKKGQVRWDYWFETHGNDPSIMDYSQRTKVRDPSGGVRTVFYNTGINYYPGVDSDTDQLGNTYKYSYVGTPVGFKIATVARPDATWSDSTLTGGYTKYSYDTRGNVVEVRQVARSGSGLPDTVVQAGYDSSCANDKTCNKPNWVIDAKGGQTDFEYSPVHGQILKETGPADASGVRLQKRYSYTLLYPRVRNSSGALVNSTPVYRLTAISTCKSATSTDPASCVGSSEEIKTTYSYNSDNLLLTSQTQVLGDGSLSAATSYTYDNIGNVTSVDGPRTDIDDRTYTTYDVLRRPVFEVGASPGGDGTKPRLVTKHNYDSDGREYLTQSGTGMATDGTDFVVDRFIRRSYDAVSGLLTKEEVVTP